MGLYHRGFPHSPWRKRLGLEKSTLLTNVALSISSYKYRTTARRRLALRVLSKDVSDLVNETLVLKILCFDLGQLLQKLALLATQAGRRNHGN